MKNSNILAYTRGKPELECLVAAWEGLDDTYRCIALADIVRYAEEIKRQHSKSAALAAAKIVLRRMSKDADK